MHLHLSPYVLTHIQNTYLLLHALSHKYTYFTLILTTCISSSGPSSPENPSRSHPASWMGPPMRDGETRVGAVDFPLSPLCCSPFSPNRGNSRGPVHTGPLMSGGPEVEPQLVSYSPEDLWRTAGGAAPTCPP